MPSLTGARTGTLEVTQSLEHSPAGKRSGFEELRSKRTHVHIQQMTISLQNAFGIRYISQMALQVTPIAEAPSHRL